MPLNGNSVEYWVKTFAGGPGIARFFASGLQLEDWLGGLDSNQDSQIQSLESYQLDDLPADGRQLKVASV